MQDLIGKIVKVSSYRGGPRNRVCKVVAVRDTRESYPAIKSRLRHLIHRSRWLITVFDIGRNVYRSYYHEFAEIKPLTLLQEINTLFWGAPND